MLVTKGTPRLLSLIFTISVIVICCYFALLAEITNQGGNNQKKQNGRNKRIVAYSLLKQIELESREFNCDRGILIEDEKKRENNTNTMWTNIEKSNVYIYSFYHDERLHPHRYLRIIAMIKGTWNDTLFCQILSSDGRYHITKATATKIWSENWNQNDTTIYFNPYLLSCHIPSNTTLVHFSLNKEPCRVSWQKFKTAPSQVSEKNQNSFTICVKPLNFFEDVSDRLLQWIAINQVLGADKIEFYVESVPKKTKTFLEKLVKSSNGTVLVHLHRKVENSTNFDQIKRLWQKRRYELISYNDCLYRNIHTSQFVVPVDVDEIIVPRHVSKWAELLQEVLLEGEDNFASFTVRNAYYLRRFNNGKRKKSGVFFLDDVFRSEFSDEGESGKSFVSTKNTLTVFNHYALKALKPGVRRNRFLNSDLVQMNHYKDDCSIVILPECAKYLSSPVRIADKIIFKYRGQFYQQHAKLLRIIGQSL